MRILRSLALAFGAILTLSTPVLAHDLVANPVREYPPGTNLSWRFAATYPAAIQSAASAALGSDWSNRSFNNSRLPTFTYSGGGSGTIYYTSSPTSPCGTGNAQWLQCASNWGSSAWRIYVRNFAGAPYSNWTWCNLSYSGTCWDVERALIHEAEHVTLAVGSHDGQGQSNTVMSSVSPWYANAGWNTHHIQRCDEATGQLLAGVASPYGPIADCFDHVAGHGVAGLVPRLTASTTSISVCLSQTANVSGAFGIASDSRYGALSGQLLGGRTVWLDRKPHTSSTWTLNIASAATSAAGANWSRGISTGSSSTISYDFRPHTSAEPGVDAATGPVIVVTWRSGC